MTSSHKVGRHSGWLFARIFACFLAISTIGSAGRCQAASHKQASTQPSAQSSASAPAPAAASVTSGTVKTAEGAPVPSATVRLTNTDTNKSWVSWTDESGKFEFPTLPRGHYRVEASQLGFVRSSTEVQLPVPANKALAV